LLKESKTGDPNKSACGGRGKWGGRSSHKNMDTTFLSLSHTRTHIRAGTVSYPNSTRSSTATARSAFCARWVLMRVVKTILLSPALRDNLLFPGGRNRRGPITAGSLHCRCPPLLPTAHKAPWMNIRPWAHEKGLPTISRGWQVILCILLVVLCTYILRTVCVCIIIHAC
jgi:hypothetical protein